MGAGVSLLSGTASICFDLTASWVSDASPLSFFQGWFAAHLSLDAWRRKKTFLSVSIEDFSEGVRGVKGDLRLNFNKFLVIAVLPALSAWRLMLQPSPVRNSGCVGPLSGVEHLDEDSQSGDSHSHVCSPRQMRLQQNAKAPS